VTITQKANFYLPKDHGLISNEFLPSRKPNLGIVIISVCSDHDSTKTEKVGYLATHQFNWPRPVKDEMPSGFLRNLPNRPLLTTNG
jgi:hypothetical protein